MLKRRSLIYLFTDGFDDLSQLLPRLRQFPSAGHDLTVFQIAAPEEANFPFHRPTRFRSLEQLGLEKPIDPARLRAGYLERYREFCETLQHECIAAGIDHVHVRTSDSFATVLGNYLDRRSAR